MRIALYAAAATLTLAMATPVLADTMARDGGPTGSNGGAQFNNSQRYNNERPLFYEGRSVGRGHAVVRDWNEY